MVVIVKRSPQRSECVGAAADERGPLSAAIGDVERHGRRDASGRSPNHERRLRDARGHSYRESSRPSVLAADINERVENIGARRLQTVLERLLEEISFAATDKAGETVKIDAAYVNERVAPLAQKGDLSRFIL